MGEPILIDEGDATEKHSWPSLKHFFPHYETFWQQHIYPLRSEGSIYLRDGMDEDFEVLAMYHYSTYVNVARAHQKIEEEWDDFAFPEEIYANMQRAGELALRTVQSFRKIYEQCIKRPVTVTTCKLEQVIENRLKPYRNLLHQELSASRKDSAGRRQIPRPEGLPGYKLWSQVLYHGRKEDFVDAKAQLLSDFFALCSTLEEPWSSMCAASPLLVTNPTYLEKRGAGRSTPVSNSLTTPPVSTTFIAISSNVIDGFTVIESTGKRKM